VAVPNGGVERARPPALAFSGRQPAPDPARIGVVIPYFQREAGLLGRALRSVAAQEHPPVQVVVVDDGSPRPALDEITPQLEAGLPGLTLIRQDNRGVAAARNAALDALTPEVSAVALLDSDDYWEPSHLRYAAAALALGADFFFADSRDEDGTQDRFHDHPRLGAGEAVPTVPGLARWVDGAAGLMRAACPFHTCTVVFRRSLMPGLRFPVEFRRAGEDHIAFWELLIRSALIMFCTRPTLVVGKGGLGTWQHATSFGSVAHLVRLADEIRLRRHVLRSYPLSTQDRRQMRGDIALRRRAALHSALHLVRHGREQAVREVLGLLKCDPACAASWCIELPKLLVRKLAGCRRGRGSDAAR
jgi:succinoglycan biosynthesis protein ExoW